MRAVGGKPRAERIATIEWLEYLVSLAEQKAKQLLDEETSLREREHAVAILTDVERLKQRVQVAPQRKVRRGV